MVPLGYIVGVNHSHKMDTLGRLKVRQLKAELSSRGEDSRGSKAVLVDRLKDVLEKEGIDLLEFVTESGVTEDVCTCYSIWW